MPQRLFGTAGFAYIGAMVCSIEALKYVNFPTKELGKSCKVRVFACYLEVGGRGGGVQPLVTGKEPLLSVEISSRILIGCNW